MNKKVAGSVLFGVVAFLFFAGFSNKALAAVNNATSTVLQVNQPNTVMADQVFPVLGLQLNNPSTTLSSVTVTVATTTEAATSTLVSTSSFDWVGLYQATTTNMVVPFDLSSDTLLATSSVNINSTTTITAPTSTSGTGYFFVVLKTASSTYWTDNGAPETSGAVAEQVTVGIATSSIVTSGGAATTTPTTTAAFTADIHSQQPTISNLSASYNNGSYYIHDSGSGGVDEQGTLNVYSSSGATSTIATSSINANGDVNVNVGNSYISSVWLTDSDAAGNAESSPRVEYHLPTAPIVSSFKAFPDRIIVNLNENVNGGQANNCSNYQINGQTLNCGGSMNAPFIDFMGNQFTIMNLSLTQGATASLEVTGLIQDNNNDQFPLAFSSSTVVQTSSIPGITSVSPASGKAGDTVTITGSNFGASGTVLFSGGFNQSTGPLPPVQASTTGWTATSITATVPAGAQSGPVQVINSTGMNSDVNPNTFFSVVGNYYVKLALATSSSPITTSTNMRVFIGAQNGQNIYYVGDGSTTFSTSTYVYTIPDISSEGFVWAYDASGGDLPAPGTQLQSGTSTSSPQVLILSTSTVNKVSGTLALGATYGANKLVAVMAMPQGAQVQMGPGGVQPAFFETDGSGNADYVLALPGNGTYDVEAHMPPSTTTIPISDPSGQAITISNTTTTATANFTFTSATREIYGQIVGANGNPLLSDQYNNMWVVAYQPVQNGKSSSGNPNGNGYFGVYANDGVYKLNITGPNVPGNVTQSITVTDDPSFDIGATTPVVTIKLQPPSSYISGYVKDGSGNAVSGVNIYAFCQNGPGHGNAVTDSQGYYRLFVLTCSSYDVGGFAQNYGKLSDQTSVVVSNSSNPSINFTLDNSNFVTISGTIKQNSANLSGANVWITQGDFGPGMAGGQTASDGTFSLKIQKGLSNLYLHASVMGQSQVADQELNSGSAVNSDLAVPTISASVATITIHLEPGNTFSQAFINAQSSLGGGYTNTLVSTSSSYDTYQIQVPYSGSTDYTIMGGVPNFGPIPATTTSVSGDETVTISLGSVNVYTISGLVSGSYTDAYVWAAGSSGGGGVKVASDGSFSIQLRQGTYDVGVNKPGYSGSVISQLNVNASTSSLTLTLATTTQTLSGTTKYNGSPVANVKVWASNNSGGWSGATSDANGNFSISVGSGSYTLNAVADGYNGVPQIVTAPASSIILNLNAVSFESTQQAQSVSPTTGGVVQTSNVQLSVPQGAMGSGTSNVQLSITNTMSTPDTKGTKVVGTGEEIDATYASGSNAGQSISTLSSNATLQFVMTKSQLTSEGISSITGAQNLMIGYYDNTANAWVQVPTTVTLTPLGATWDTLTSVTLSGTTSHFSTYAPIQATSQSAPATPTNVSAAAGNVYITISWTAVSGVSTYNVYRQNGSQYLYLAQTSGTSYTDNSVTAGTTYQYEVTSLDSNSNESAASGPVSTVPLFGGGGMSISGGGGSTGLIIPTTTTTSVTSMPTSTVSATTTETTLNTSPTAVTPSLPSSAISAIFNVTLRLGSRGKDVTRLQEVLAQNKEIYPEGLVTGYFGQLTEQAVKKFQAKYGIVTNGSSRTTGYGLLGPKTRAMLTQIFGSSSANQTTPSTPTTATSAAKLTSEQVIQIRAKIQLLQQEILQLLQEEVKALNSQ